MIVRNCPVCGYAAPSLLHDGTLPAHAVRRVRPVATGSKVVTIYVSRRARDRECAGTRQAPLELPSGYAPAEPEPIGGRRRTMAGSTS